jgi:hypothetical protein
MPRYTQSNYRRVYIDSSAGALKAALRLAVTEYLAGPSDTLRVLDAFAGKGKLWRAVARASAVNLEVLGIDQEKRTSRLNIMSRNERLLRSINLGSFHVVDLDSYGIPAEQAHVLGMRKYPGPVIWTAASASFAHMPRLIVEYEGMPWEWDQLARSVLGDRDRDRLGRRFCDYMTRLGWHHHAFTTLTTRVSHIYGVSSRGELPVSRASLAAAYSRLTGANGGEYAGHEYPMGGPHLESDDRVHEDHGGL